MRQISFLKVCAVGEIRLITAMDSHRFSPLRAVMMWKSSDPHPERAHLIKLGMWTYVYDPLGLPFPSSASKYQSDARAVFEYVTLGPTVMFEPQLISLLKLDDEKRDTTTTTGRRKAATAKKVCAQTHWKAVTKYYFTHIERIVVSKSKNMVTDVLSAASMTDVNPLPIVDVKDLAYDKSAVALLHHMAYDLFHNNPVKLFRSLSMYMTTCDTRTGANLYTRVFMHYLAKCCKKRSSVDLTVMAYEIRKGSGLCLGPRNRNARRIVDAYTVNACPLCHKPVNVAVKKKSSVGGAHKSQIFTDEYTQQPLYCTEKNHRGILKFPLLTYRNGKIFGNTLTWIINTGFVRQFSVVTQHGKACMIITNKNTGKVTYVPVDMTPECALDEKYPCLFCK